jgi:hypothetical protein
MEPVATDVAGFSGIAPLSPAIGLQDLLALIPIVGAAMAAPSSTSS